MMTLYWNPLSPYARKVRMVLDHKLLPYTPVVEDLFGAEGATETLKRKSKRAEVPILEDDDRTIWDSTIICEYLDEAYPAHPVYPRGPAARARCRLLEDRCDTVLDAAVYAVYAGRVICKDAPLARDMAAAGAREVGAWLEEFDQELQGREFLCGDGLSVADIALFTHVSGAVTLGIPLAGAERVAAWMARMAQLPAVRKDMEAVSQAWAQARSSVRPQRHQWRSDRLEFGFRHDLVDFLLDEIARGRAYFPPSPGEA